MARTLRIPTEADEMRILVLRRHWWLLIPPLLPIVVCLALLPLYAAVEYLLPQADLSRYESLFLTGDLALGGLAAVKWLAADLAPWYTERCVLTSRRAMVHHGVLVQERRELALHRVRETAFDMRGAPARFFHYGDLRIEPSGSGQPLIFRAVPRPRKVQGLLAAHARAAREQRGGAKESNSAIAAALARIFQEGDGPETPTLEVAPVTALTARAQRRLTPLPGEVVLAATRRHHLVLVERIGAPLAVCAILGGLDWRLGTPIPLAWLPILALLMGLWAFWGVFGWWQRLYVLTTERVAEMGGTPLAQPIRRAVRLGSVEDVTLRQVMGWGRICGVGTLAVAIGDEQPVCLRAVPAPWALQRRLLDAVETARRREQFQEQERLASTLTDWFEEYHRRQLGP